MKTRTQSHKEFSAGDLGPSDNAEVTVSEKMQAQLSYVERRKVPHFAPKNGICYSCGQQIYTEITLKRASSELITGCPHCARTYCD